jgi:oxygen-independent coproporphyrinogen-3 oxidase
MQKSKADLAIETYKNTLPLTKVCENEYSLYISVPFCPAKCKYCSFVSFSASTKKFLKLIPAYIKKLTGEIELISELAYGKRLKSVYIGGGTPTVLDCGQLEIILKTIKNNFNAADIAEYTAECGRADTITEEKLTLLKSFGVDRISVNPQTLNDDILKNIGRGHTSGDFFRAFETAKKTGIKNINTDCIIGLPGESGESMINTIKILTNLKPENITVHSLSIKKSSELRQKNYSFSNTSHLNGILGEYYDILKDSGYKPYYMYRQKYAAENLENTGFCLENRECLYNIYMMDELMTVFGAGAGAMTKIVKNNRNKRIERIANYKYPYEYIENDFKKRGGLIL